MQNSTSQEQEREMVRGLSAENPTRSSARGKSPLRQAQAAGEDKTEPAEAEDADMAEDGEVKVETDHVVASAIEPTAGVEESKGEGGEAGHVDLVMDTS